LAKFFTRIARCGRGATALEFAFVAPPLLLLVIGTLDFGRLLWTDAALQDATARAARCIAVTPEACQTRRAVTATALSAATAPALAGARFSIARGACGAVVRARLPFRSLLPLPRPMVPVLRATACVP
jgi:Flp pilus assembly protein TadG